jgi:hypothetical protein
MTRFEKYMNNIETVIMEAEININDPGIKKITRGIWEFKYEGSVYNFVIDRTWIKGLRGFTVQWGLIGDDGKLTTEIVGSKDSKHKIFSKVLSCLVIFLKQENPEVFSMLAYDKKLAGIYDLMWLRHKGDKPFNEYNYREVKKHKDLKGNTIYVYYYSKKLKDQLTEESEWIELLKEGYGITYEFELHSIW